MRLYSTNRFKKYFIGRHLSRLGGIFGIRIPITPTYQAINSVAKKAPLEVPFLCFTLLYEIHVSHEDRTMSVSLRLPEDLSQRLSSLASSDGSRGIVTVGVGGSSPQTGFVQQRR